MNDLFSSAAQDHLDRRAPLAARLRPVRLDDVVGQRHLLAPGMPLRTLIESDELSSVILWGPPGTGKTTLARVIARATEKEFVELSAVSASVKDVREVIATAEHRLGQRGVSTILFLDEVHRFNKSQQDALLPSVESGLLLLIGATTENPFFEVNAPLLSRSILFRLELLDDDATRQLVQRGLDEDGATADDDAIEHLVAHAAGDGRHILTSLEVAIALAAATGTPPHVGLKEAESALGMKAMRYGRDQHYDVISAFIKSIRGSDADAGLYWLQRMILAGEDARFIARRLVVLASEDIGMADPMALVVANAAAHAVEFVGLPEAKYALGQAVVHLATAPKSNRVTIGLGRAAQAAQDSGGGEVPIHLRDAHYKGAKTLGHGDGYRYPHDDPAGWVEQEHRPTEVAGQRYYEPSAHGFEAEVAERMNQRTPDPDER